MSRDTRSVLEASSTRRVLLFSHLLLHLCLPSPPPSPYTFFSPDRVLREEDVHHKRSGGLESADRSSKSRNAREKRLCTREKESTKAPSPFPSPSYEYALRRADTRLQANIFALLGDYPRECFSSHPSVMPRTYMCMYFRDRHFYPLWIFRRGAIAQPSTNGREINQRGAGNAVVTKRRRGNRDARDCALSSRGFITLILTTLSNGVTLSVLRFTCSSPHLAPRE